MLINDMILAASTFLVIKTISVWKFHFSKCSFASKKNVDDDQNDFILFLVLESSQKSFQFPTKCFQRTGFHEMHFLTSHSQTNNLHFTIKAISLTYRQNYSLLKIKNPKTCRKFLFQDNSWISLGSGIFLNILRNMFWFTDILNMRKNISCIPGKMHKATKWSNLSGIKLS